MHVWGYYANKHALWKWTDTDWIVWVVLEDDKLLIDGDYDDDNEKCIEISTMLLVATN